MSKDGFLRFKGTERYIASPALVDAVNCAIALERPLLLKGEPGTGKTVLAQHIAEGLGMPMLSWHIKSTSKAADGLYVYDTVQRLNDSRFGDSGRDVSNIEEYIKMGKIGQAFTADRRTVLLIDEIDKADTDFQDDMLDVLDQMEFDIIEIDKRVGARHRPVIAEVNLDVVERTGVPRTAFAIERLARAGDDSPTRLREQLHRRVTDASRSTGKDHGLAPNQMPLGMLFLGLGPIIMEGTGRDFSARRIRVGLAVSVRIAHL